MTRQKIVITEFMDTSAVDTLSQHHEVLYDPTLVKDRARLLPTAAHADAIIVRNLTQVNEELLQACTRLRFVGRLGVGLDNIDLPACSARGIQVQPATGANAAAVAEYVITATMMLLRGAWQSTAQVVAGEWPRPQLSNGRETAGKLLGLVGFGSIGQEVAKRALALGMRVHAHDPVMPDSAPVWAQMGVTPRTLEALLAEADAISLHVPLTPQTRHLMSAERIAGMRHGAMLINTARGHITDEAAVARALRTGQLGGAAIDVFDSEPVGIDNTWKDCPHLLLTPHIAGVTVESNERVSHMIARATLDFLGAPQEQMNEHAQV